MRSVIYCEDSEYDSDVLESLYECRHALRKMGCKIYKENEKIVFTDLSGFINLDDKINILSPNGCNGEELEKIIDHVFKNTCGNSNKSYFENNIWYNTVHSTIEASVFELYASLSKNKKVPHEFKKVEKVIHNLRQMGSVDVQNYVRNLSSLYQDLVSINNIELTEKWSSETILLYKLCLILVCNFKIAEKLKLPIADVLLLPSSFLFERFVCNHVKKCLEPDYIVRPQQYHEYLSKVPDKGPVGIRPDITVYLDSKAILVIDSKYKTFNRKTSYPDLHQMSTYISVLETRTGILVYPHCKNKTNFEECDDIYGIEFCKSNVTEIKHFCNFIKDCLEKICDSCNI